MGKVTKGVGKGRGGVDGKSVSVKGASKARASAEKGKGIEKGKGGVDGKGVSVKGASEAWAGRITSAPRLQAWPASRAGRARRR